MSTFPLLLSYPFVFLEGNRFDNERFAHLMVLFCVGKKGKDYKRVLY